jgi:hypothetical protein
VIVVKVSFLQTISDDQREYCNLSNRF